MSIAAEFARRGVGVLAILHDLNLAAQYADHILVMKSGRALAYGTPNDVLTFDVIHDAFDIDVVVQAQPCLSGPLIVALPQTVSLSA